MIIIIIEGGGIQGPTLESSGAGRGHNELRELFCQISPESYR